MKKSELKPGTKVIACMKHPADEWSDDVSYVGRYTPNEYRDDYLIGVVLIKATSNANKVFVSWIEGELEGEEQEVDVKVLSLVSDRGTLEKEFKEAQKAIKEKLKEAGNLVREANKIAQKAGAQSLADMYDVVDPLV